MHRQLPSWLPRVLFESALIVFSVLFALVLNEWRGEAAQRHRVAQALSAIHAEIQENQRLVQEALEYHTTISASFQRSAGRGDEMPDLEAIGQGIIAPARVLRTAWESAQSTGVAADIPYATVLKLSTAYARQEEYEALSRSLAQVAYDRVMREGIEAMLRQYPRFVLIQNDFAGRERLLLHEYREMLEQLEPAGPDRPGS